MAETARLAVEVVYATSAAQEIVHLDLAVGSTLGQALAASGLAAQHPGIDLGSKPVGIFGQLAGVDSVLADGDRVEIYRPLQLDPKEARRQRAAAQRQRAADKARAAGG